MGARHEAKSRGVNDFKARPRAVGCSPRPSQRIFSPDAASKRALILRLEHGSVLNRTIQAHEGSGSDRFSSCFAFGGDPAQRPNAFWEGGGLIPTLLAKEKVDILQIEPFERDIDPAAL